MYKAVTVSLIILGIASLALADGYKDAEVAHGKAKAVSTESTTTDPTPDYLHIPLETITGDTVHLADFKGQVLLLVNTASKCGYTPQYEGLQELYTRFKDSGLVVIGFPANNFGNQEPGTDEQIAEFCSANFGVTFPMMSKVSVRGDDKHPLFVYLTENSPHSGEVQWNFSKFLIDRSGKLSKRFPSKTKPLSDEMTENVRDLLKARSS